jgi:hypothetical protein
MKNGWIKVGTNPANPANPADLWKRGNAPLRLALLLTEVMVLTIKYYRSKETNDTLRTHQVNSPPN